MKTLTEMLTEREAIAQLCETILDEGTGKKYMLFIILLILFFLEHWGVKVNVYNFTYKIKKLLKNQPIILLKILFI